MSNKYRRLLTMLLVVVLLAVRLVHAGGTAPCTDPTVFENQSVNVVVLPYVDEAFGAGGVSDGPDLGERLASLVQAEVLLSMLKYRSVGATRLYVPTWRGCSPEYVINRATHGTTGALRSGAGLLVIWGRIYTEKSKIYLQSYMRFLRRGVAESMSVTFSSPAGAPFVLDAKLPTQTMSMQLHAVTRNDLEKVASAYQTDLVIRDAPDEVAHGTALSLGISRPFSYAVLDAKGDWMRIRAAGNIDGWVKARAEDETWRLRRLMPELAYMDGVVGYLRLRDRSEAKEPPPPQAMKWIERDFDDYEAAVGGDSSPLPLGIGRMLRGVLLWEQAEGTGAAELRREAAGLFAEALKLMPDYAASHSLAAITRPYLAEGAAQAVATMEVQRELDSGLLGALSMDAKNADALDNLAKIYQLSSASAESPALYDNMKVRLDVIRDIRAAAKTR